MWATYDDRKERKDKRQKSLRDKPEREEITRIEIK
jgi:hypothetical protein